MHITALYAAIFGLLFVALSVRTLRVRGRLGILVGDDGNPQMLRAVRVHANFAEYVPFALLLIYFVEIGGASGRLIHAVCLCLLAGRLAHAYGVGQLHENLRFRVFGMAMTFGAIVVAAAILLVSHVA